MDVLTMVVLKIVDFEDDCHCFASFAGGREWGHGVVGGEGHREKIDSLKLEIDCLWSFWRLLVCELFVF
jgi:hypothetical protein